MIIPIIIILLAVMGCLVLISSRERENVAHAAVLFAPAMLICFIYAVDSIPSEWRSHVGESVENWLFAAFGIGIALACIGASVLACAPKPVDRLDKICAAVLMSPVVVSYIAIMIVVGPAKHVAF